MSVEKLSQADGESISGDDVVLGRVPANLRHSIWKSSPTEIRSIILDVNMQLKQFGMEELSKEEVDDAYEGNWVMNLKK